MTKQPDLQVGDVQEVEAANELEFRQRRKDLIRLVAQSLVEILPKNFTHAPQPKREQILMTFLFQIRKEDDTEVKAVLKEETYRMMRYLIESLGKQKWEDRGTGLDWILLCCIKWTMASEQLSLPPEFSLASLGNTLADQLHRWVS